MMFDEKYWREQFSEHEVHYANYGPYRELYWAKPRTRINSILYVIRSHCLYVSGDLGDAIYHWSNNLSWEFLSNLGLDYFASKCEASEYGEGYLEWDDKVALSTAKEYIYEVTDKEPNDDLIIDMQDALADGGKHGWAEFLNDHHELFGTDWWESRCLCGETIALRCRIQLLGLRLSYARSKSVVTAEEGQRPCV